MPSGPYPLTNGSDQAAADMLGCAAWLAVGTFNLFLLVAIYRFLIGLIT